jgi:hypothetical protein
MTDILYRYEIQYKSEDGDTDVHLRELKVLQETDKTYVIENYHQKKRVYKNAHNSYAYASKEHALKHLIRRTHKRISWFEFWVEECNKALDIAKTLEAQA